MGKHTIQHPSNTESAILVCSALVFAVEKWDDFVALTIPDGDADAIKGMKEIKLIIEHLIGDLFTYVEVNEMISDGLEKMVDAIIFGKKRAE